VRGIENTSGPLGQGHTIAAGALARFLVPVSVSFSHKIFTFISDGGVRRNIAGSRAAAGFLTNNLIMFTIQRYSALETKVNCRGYGEIPVVGMECNKY
jgi:transketolase